MRWEGGRRSSNVEDRRGRSSRKGIVGGGLGTIVLVLVALYFGVDPTFLVQGLPTGPGQAETGPPGEASPGQPDAAADFISVVLADTEDAWAEVFAESGQRYQPPKLVLFTDFVQSACGNAEAAMGPFYCPADQQAYIDLGFYRDLRERFNAPGYGQLAFGADVRIRTLGPGDDAMGAFGFLLEAHKWINLNVRLGEFMPIGVRPLTVAVT